MNLALPKISVIVPVYNVENYVSKCLESIINQTYKNIEIIIVNDGSTDNSGNICEYYSKKDDRIILTNQKNQGLSMARNNALDIASGDYIGFVDSDDWIELDMYYTLFDSIIAYNADISMCNFYYLNEDGKLVQNENGEYTFKENNLITKTVMEGEDKITHFFDFMVYNVSTWNKLYDKKLFNEIRYPCNKIYEDAFITHKLIDKANKIVALPDYKYYYLRRNGSITKSRFALNQLDRVEANINRYNDVTAKYPKFENICRKYIFTSLLNCINRAFQDNAIAIYKKEIEIVIKKVSEYSIDDCGLSKYEKSMLELIYNNTALSKFIKFSEKAATAET